MTHLKPAVFSHSGAFSLLFLLSILHPAGFYASANFPIAPLVLVILIIVCLQKAITNANIFDVVRAHKTLILSSLAFFTLSCISLLVNFSRYPDTATFLRWGAIFVVFPMAIPIAILLAKLPDKAESSQVSTANAQGTDEQSLLSKFIQFAPAIIALAIPITAIWQRIHFDSYAVFAKIFITSAAMEPLNIRGLLAISTDLGAISGILFVASSLLLIQTRRVHKKESLLLLLILTLNAFAGLLSGARVFILMALVGFIALAIQLFISRKSLLFGLFTLGAAVISLLLQFVPVHTATKLAQILPAILYLKLGLPVSSNSFIPNLSSSAFGDRESIWSRAIEQIVENPLTGISNGAFRLLSEQEGETRINNTHNMFLQAGIDAGVLGFAIVAVGCVYVLYKYSKKALFPLLAAIFSSLLVDNFTDHSFPWIIVACSVLCLTPLNAPINTTLKQKLSPQPIFIAALLILGLSSTNYAMQVHQFKKSPLVEQVQSALLLHPQSSYQPAPAFITPKLAEQLTQASKENTLTLPQIINTERLCDYLYPGVSVFSFGGELEMNASRFSEAMLQTNLSGLLSRGEHKKVCSIPLHTPINVGSWVSNYGSYIEQHLVRRNGKPALRLMYEGVALWTPAFKLANTRSLRFKTQGVAVQNKSPELMLSFYDLASGKLLMEEIKTIPSTENTHIFDISGIEADSIFIKARLLYYSSRKELNEYQIVYISDVELI